MKGSAGERRHHLAQRRMVGRVLIDVLVADRRAGADHKRPPQLGDPPTALLHPEASSISPDSARHASRVKEQRKEANAADRRCSGRRRVVIDEHWERDPLLGDERAGVSLVTGPDGDDLRAGRRDRVVMLTQLRGVLPAEQSAEVAEENEDGGAGGPVVAEPVGRPIGPHELDIFEASEVHKTAA